MGYLDTFRLYLRNPRCNHSRRKYELAVITTDNEFIHQSDKKLLRKIRKLKLRATSSDYCDSIAVDLYVSLPPEHFSTIGGKEG